MFQEQNTSLFCPYLILIILTPISGEILEIKIIQSFTRVPAQHTYTLYLLVKMEFDYKFCKKNLVLSQKFYENFYHKATRRYSQRKCSAKVNKGVKFNKKVESILKSGYKQYAR